MKQKPTPFKLRNGISALIVGLEDASAAHVVESCWNLDFVKYPSCLREWFVLTVRIGPEKVHLLYRFPGGGDGNGRRGYALSVKQKMMRKRWEILRDASFAVYKGVAYDVNEAAFAAFEYAILNKVSPTIAILATQQPANDGS